MESAIIIIATVFIFLAIGYWWRYKSLACPASLSWLVQNRYMDSVAGADKIFERIGLKKGMKLLDCGAGPGRLSLPAAELVGGEGEVVAVDIQSEMLEKLSAGANSMKLENIRLVHSALGSGSVEKEYFDRALLVTVLGEVQNKGAALAEIFEALKKGGILSVTEVVPDPHYTSKKRVRTLCSEAGFKELESFGSWLAFTINFVKPEN